MGWLSESGVLPRESKPIEIDPAAVCVLVFHVPHNAWKQQRTTKIVTFIFNIWKIQNAALNTAVFNKEQDARRHGALITNRPKLQDLKKQRSKWLRNQQIAIKQERQRSIANSSNNNNNNKNKKKKNDKYDYDEFDLERSSKILQEKAKKYDKLMTGEQTSVNSECLVDFGLKGINIDTNDSNFDKNIAN